MVEEHDKLEAAGMRSAMRTIPVLFTVASSCLLMICYFGSNVAFRNNTYKVGKMRLMAERALKESVVFDKHAVDLGFSPKLRLKELQTHFDEVYQSGISELRTALPYLDEFSQGFMEYCDSEDTNAYDFARLDEKGRLFVNSVDKIHYDMMDKNTTYFWAFGTSITICVLFIVVTYMYDRKFEQSKKKFQQEILEKDLARARQESDASQATLSQVCHEMRGHMAVVMLALEQALEDARFCHKSDLATSLEYGVLAASEQSNVLQNRMEMHKLLCGHFVPNKEPIDAVSLTKDIIKRRSINISNLMLKFECELESLWISVDIYLVDRVINNLLSNSIKNTSEGFITVKLSMVDFSESDKSLVDSSLPSPTSPLMDSDQKKERYFPHLKLKDGESILQIRVIDTGIGIDSSRHAGIFNKGNFVADRRGTGLGLPFVKQIATSLGGDVKVESSVLGEGSCFLVELPTTRCASMENEIDDSSSTLSGNNPMPLSPLHNSSEEEENDTPSDFNELAQGLLSSKKLTDVDSANKREKKETHSKDISYHDKSDKNTFENSGARKKYSTANSSETMYNLKSSISSKDMRKALSYASSDSETNKKSYDLPSDMVCLLADDQRIIRVMMKKRLSNVAKGLNWTFLEATTGEATLALIKDHKVDVITMDENMEGEGGRMRGTDAICKLRQLGFKGVIIGLSGDFDASERQINAGANFSWGKPLPSEAKMYENLASALKYKTKLSLMKLDTHSEG